MQHDPLDRFTKKILVDLKECMPTDSAIACYIFHDEHTENFELTRHVTDALLALWEDGYIVANVSRVDPSDATSCYLRPTDIQLTDKGFQAAS